MFHELYGTDSQPSPLHPGFKITRYYIIDRQSIHLACQKPESGYLLSKKGFTFKKLKIKVEKIQNF
jgi:hypothetical protein